MKLPKYAKYILFSCAIVGTVALYIVIVNGFIDALVGVYDQVVIDFGNPKDN